MSLVVMCTELSPFILVLSMTLIISRDGTESQLIVTSLLSMNEE